MTSGSVSASTPAIAVTDLRKAYGGIQALVGVDLAIVPGTVYQELSLFPERSILANLFPDRQPTRFGLVDRAEMRRRAAPALSRLGLAVDPDTTVGDLGIAERQLV